MEILYQVTSFKECHYYDVDIKLQYKKIGSKKELILKRVFKKEF